MIPPPTRKIACRLTVTYAGFSGESALLEELYKRGMAEPEIAPGLRAGDGLLMAWHHEPIAPWQTPAWLSEMKRSLRPQQYLRMIENRFVSSESSFVDLASWDACVDPSATPMLARRSARPSGAMLTGIALVRTVYCVSPILARPDGRVRF
jgi:hypothetical protein